MVPLLVPLFVGAFRRADELAMAMEARCYRRRRGPHAHAHAAAIPAATRWRRRAARSHLLAAVIALNALGVV